MRPALLFLVLLISYWSLAQETPTLKEQLILDDVTDVSADARSNVFLVSRSDAYTLIDQSSKLQVGTIQLDADALAIPGAGLAIPYSATSILISTGTALLKADVVSGKIDTLYSAAFPTFIINFTSLKDQHNIILLALKTYTPDSKGVVRAFTTDKNNKVQYDDGKNCQLALLDISNKKIITTVSTPHAITVFAASQPDNNIIAGDFDGDVIRISKTGLTTTTIAHPFSKPVHSLLVQDNILISASHLASKYIGNNADGILYITNLNTKQQMEILLPKETPVIPDGSSMTPGPSNLITRLLSLPQQSTVFASFGFSRLLKINSVTLDTISLPVKENAVNFFCFNRDSTQILTAVSKVPGVFGPNGNLSMYSIQKQKFRLAFRKPLAELKQDLTVKFFDSQGNYHYITKRSSYSADSIFVYSSNRTTPILFLVPSDAISFNPADTTMSFHNRTRLVSGKLRLENLSLPVYKFNFDYNSISRDRFDTSIFQVDFAQLNTIFPDVNHKAESISTLNGKNFLIEADVYQKSASAKRWLITDAMGKVLLKSAIHGKGITTPLTDLSHDKTLLAYHYEEANSDFLEVWNLQTMSRIYQKKIVDGKLEYFAFDKLTNTLWFTTQKNFGPVTMYSISTGNLPVAEKKMFEKMNFLSFQTDMANDVFAAENYDELFLFRLSTQQMLYRFPVRSDGLEMQTIPSGFGFSSDNSYYQLSHAGNLLETRFYDGNRKIEVYNRSIYAGDKNAVSNYAVVEHGHAYPPLQYDMYFNRPDSMLIVSGSTNKKHNDLIARTTLKRRSGHQLKTLSDLFTDSTYLVASNENAIPDVVSKEELRIDVEAGSATALSAIHVLDNNVPVFGSKGLIITDKKDKIAMPLNIPLVNGQNNLQLYAEDAAGNISKTSSLSVYSDATIPDSRIYFFGIGVSRYADHDNDLHYADKDIRDLASAFRNKYPNAVIDTLTNEAATRENILALKNRLNKTGVNDRVVVCLSGHGMIDENLGFYFAAHDMDFKQPALKGVSYDALQDLLDGIPARKKILLIDACHSGELDQEISIQSEIKTDSTTLKQYKPSKGFGVKPASESLNIQSSFELMREVFATTGKNNGAIVISAAGGLEFALEDEKYNNGVFTYAILKGLVDGAADMDGNSKISVNELRTYVGSQVELLTHGKQKPTTRQEILDYDWELW